MRGATSVRRDLYNWVLQTRGYNNTSALEWFSMKRIIEERKNMLGLEKFKWLNFVKLAIFFINNECCGALSFLQQRNWQTLAGVEFLFPMVPPRTTALLLIWPNSCVKISSLTFDFLRYRSHMFPSITGEINHYLFCNALLLFPCGCWKFNSPSSLSNDKWDNNII